MYSREMGGVRSDGQLYAMQQEDDTKREEPVAAPDPPPKPKGLLDGLLSSRSLRDWKTEDLLLLAIGFLLLTDDRGESNELLILLVGLLLLL